MLKKILAKINLNWFWEADAPGLAADDWQKQIFPQHFWLLGQIKRLKPKRIMEAGCGFGRNLKFLIDGGVKPEILTGADISPKLLAQAGLPKSVRLVRANVLNLPFSDRCFDLVFTHGLLMHVHPRRPGQAVLELARVTKKYLILIEEIRSRPERLNYFTWAHDYDKIIARLPFKVLIKKRGPHLLVWYLLKKLNTPTRVSLTPKNF